MTFADRLEKVMALAEILPRYKQDLMSLAAKNLQFTVKDTAYEVDLTVERLKLFDHTEIFLANRGPVGGPGSSVAVMLSYNGSAWLNTVIASIYLVGNKVLAKFSSRGDELMALTEKMYAPIFGQDITFYRGDGRSFIKDSLDNPEVSTVIVFGFDTNNSYVQSQVGEVPRYSFRIQASLLIWLKVVKQTRESLGFFVKLQDILRPQRGGTL
jgi:hypothetical protein